MHDVSLIFSVYVTRRRAPLLPTRSSLCGEVVSHGAFSNLVFLPLWPIYSVGILFCSIFREGAGPAIRVL